MTYKEIKRSLKFLLKGKRPPSKKELLKLIKTVRPVLTNYELIRLGGEADGGYLAPDDLKGISACFSPGVGNISEFEKDCQGKGMEIFMADASVQDPFPNSNYFHFIKKNLGVKDNDQEVSLLGWIKSNGMDRNSNLLLQMDIEGAEYKILEKTSDKVLKQFRIIVVEFHYLDGMRERVMFNSIKKAFQKLLKNHICVHIHPNNCCGIKQVKGIKIPTVAEFTFLRRDRIYKMEKPGSFPHKLDRDNTENLPIVLPQVWYESK